MIRDLVLSPCASDLARQGRFAALQSYRQCIANFECLPVVNLKKIYRKMCMLVAKWRTLSGTMPLSSCECECDIFELVACDLVRKDRFAVPQSHY